MRVYTQLRLFESPALETAESAQSLPFTRRRESEAEIVVHALPGQMTFLDAFDRPCVDYPTLVDTRGTLDISGVMPTRS